MEDSIEVKLECAFCGSTDFEIPYEGYQPDEGEMIKCGNCGKLNDFSSIQEVAIENGKNHIEDELMKMFKKAGFTVK